MAKILLGVTGSVAAKLTHKMVRALSDAEHEVQVVFTESSLYFVNLAEVEKIGAEIWVEQDEWPGAIYKKDQEIPHIALSDWADLLLIAPLSANTLAKMANGLCDNLLTSLVRAWHRERPIVIAPAMNTRMWENPFTKKHFTQMNGSYKFRIVEPVSKKLACGDEGIGAMEQISTIAVVVDLELC